MCSSDLAPARTGPTVRGSCGIDCRVRDGPRCSDNPDLPRAAGDPGRRLQAGGGGVDPRGAIGHKRGNASRGLARPRRDFSRAGRTACSGVIPVASPRGFWGLRAHPTRSPRRKPVGCRDPSPTTPLIPSPQAPGGSRWDAAIHHQGANNDRVARESRGACPVATRNATRLQPSTALAATGTLGFGVVGWIGLRGQCRSRGPLPVAE